MKVSFKYGSSNITKGLIPKYLKMQIGFGGKNWLRNCKLALLLINVLFKVYKLSYKLTFLMKSKIFLTAD